MNQYERYTKEELEMEIFYYKEIIKECKKDIENRKKDIKTINKNINKIKTIIKERGK